MTNPLDEFTERFGTDPLESWPTVADPFAEYAVPAFPLEVLPAEFQKFCKQESAGSGFDAGGYAFTLLSAAAATIDHRHRLNIGPFRVPAFSWSGIVGQSGSGKSPVLNAAKAAAEKINDEMVRESGIEFAKWRAACDTARSNKSEPPPRPEWKQRHAIDTTTEALGQLLVDNPEGVNMFHHEITEFLGRMDAYSGKDGGKDRGVYLRAYDGGQVVINRATKQPLVVDEFSVAIIAGIQPEVLAQKFRQAGTGADGLYQRFLVYCLRPPGRVNYSASANSFTDTNIEQIFNRLHQSTDIKPVTVTLSAEARKIMEDYHNSVRTLAQRTAAARFAEHLDKFPGFLGRLCFALHWIKSVSADDDPQKFVKTETMQDAVKLMAILYRHSEAVYRLLDREAGSVRNLVKSAAEAILTKNWDVFGRADLTRNATYWQSADNREAESAIDLLIELGWLKDVTPLPIAGKAGRRSSGKFRVNPKAHSEFSEQAERIRTARKERYQALQQVAGN